MPVIDVDDNIKQFRKKIEHASQDIFRFQGMLEVFEGFMKAGLTKIDLPKSPDHTYDLESIQEKPE